MSDDGSIVICTEDGEILTTVDTEQWYSILKPIEKFGKNIFVFSRISDGEKYNVFSVYKEKLENIIKLNT